MQTLEQEGRSHTHGAHSLAFQPYYLEFSLLSTDPAEERNAAGPVGAGVLHSQKSAQLSVQSVGHTKKPQKKTRKPKPQGPEGMQTCKKCLLLILSCSMALEHQEH